MPWGALLSFSRAELNFWGTGDGPGMTGGRIRRKEGTAGGDHAEHLVRPSHILGTAAKAKLAEAVPGLVENPDTASHPLFF